MEQPRPQEVKGLGQGHGMSRRQRGEPDSPGPRPSRETAPARVLGFGALSGHRCDLDKLLPVSDPQFPRDFLKGAHVKIK